jgi:hypothetical protein
MTHLPRRETAKIYRFPTRMRIAATDVSRNERPAPARLFSICESGSGWYHEAAIQDDQRDRKS